MIVNYDCQHIFIVPARGQILSANVYNKPGGPFNPSVMFLSKPRAYPNEATNSKRENACAAVAMHVSIAYRDYK
jgi:hypothetical protein